MAQHNELGKMGEDTAVAHFEAQNYTILQRNYRYGKAEVDIIMKKDDVLIFVEVKTRSNTRFSMPETSVTPKKQQLILEAATQFMYETNYEDSFRFDVVGIVMENNGNIKDFEHYEDAFLPNWL